MSSSERTLGRKDDSGKPRFSLLPWDALEQVVLVLEFGAKQYGTHNWQQVENGYQRYLDAIGRHFQKLMIGQKFDQDSGIHHLAHIACDALFALWFALRSKDKTEEEQTNEQQQQRRRVD